MKSKNEKLTDKQKRFCEEYLIDLNATQAAIRAGYSAKTAKSIGQENLTKPDILQYVKNKQERISKKTEVTQEWVLERLVQVHDRCMQVEPVRDREGNETGEYVFKDSGAIKSLELLGKHVGMFKEKLELTVANHTEEQLIAEANELINTARAREASSNSC
jgi:phage terminase small subunit